MGKRHGEVGDGEKERVRGSVREEQVDRNIKKEKESEIVRE